MTPLMILTQAKKLIDRPDSWTKDHFSLDKDGGDVSPRNPKAACWCVLGALMRVSGNSATLLEAEELFRKAIGRNSTAKWQDERDVTHNDVMAAFDRAIELARNAVEAAAQ